ncbi:hypothetical protein LTR95_001116 [Oleoguttula sp. CCFEE 5521]
MHDAESLLWENASLRKELETMAERLADSEGREAIAIYERDATRSELALLRTENDSLRREMHNPSCGSPLADSYLEGEDMEVDSFPTPGKMTPRASTPSMAECSPDGLEVPPVAPATENLPRAVVEIGCRPLYSLSERHSSLDDALMAEHAGRSHPASPAVPESVSSRDPPSSTARKTVAGSPTGELCRDKAEGLFAISVDDAQSAAAAPPLNDRAVLALKAGSCDDDKALEDMARAQDEIRHEVGDAVEGSLKVVRPQAPDPPVNVPVPAVDEPPREVLGEATHDMPRRTIDETHCEATADAKPEHTHVWHTDTLAGPTMPFTPHEEPAQTASVISPASLPETPARNMIVDVEKGRPIPASSRSALPSPELMSPPLDWSLTDMSTELSKRDQDTEALVESSASRSPSSIHVAQGGTSCGVPASHDTAEVEVQQLDISPSTMSPLSSFANGGQVPSPTTRTGDNSVDAETSLQQLASALEEEPPLPVPQSAASDGSQIEVAWGKRPETSCTGAIEDEVTAVDNVGSSDATPQAPSSVAGDSDSTGDDELSTPLMRKTARREKKIKKSTPAGKTIGERDQLLVSGQKVQITSAKGSGRTRSRLEDHIRRSYAAAGLDPSRLIITYERPSENPLELYMSSTAKGQAELTTPRMTKLKSARSTLLACLPTAGNDKADKKDANLIRRLCLSPLRDGETSRLVDVVKALRRRSEVAGDELRLFRCLESLMITITKQHDEKEYREALTEWTKHEIECMDIYFCLNYVLLRLDERWRGLHLLLLVFLLRAGVKQLQIYFARARRPAALLLLVKGLNDPDLCEKHCPWMRQLVANATLAEPLILLRSTPLSMLQDRAKHIVRPSFVASALGYDSTYDERALQPAWPSGSSQERKAHDPASLSPSTAASRASDLPISGVNAAAAGLISLARKRPLSSATGYDETTSPTKRRRLDDLAQDFSEIHEPAESDDLPTADSEGTDYSRFRYYGAMASTSENNFTYTESSNSPVSPWAFPLRSSDVRAESTAPAGPPLQALASLPTAKPEPFPPTTDVLLNGRAAIFTPARRDWGVTGKCILQSSREKCVLTSAVVGTPSTSATIYGVKRKRSLGEAPLTEGRAINRPRLDAQHDDCAPAPESVHEHSVAGNKLGLSKTSGSRHHSSIADTEKEADIEQVKAEGVGNNTITEEHIRTEAESLAKTLEQNGQEIWTGDAPLIMLSPGMCKAEDLRKLATDGRLNDEFVNIVPLLGDHEDVKEYLLPTFVMELVREARYKDLDTWAAKIPKQAKRWAFGVHESGHWMAVRIDWVQRLIQHYDPMHQGATARSRLTLKHVERWARHRDGGQSVWRLEKFDGPFQAKDDYVNCGVYVTWVLRHWIRGNDLDAASLTCPLAFKMEILRLLRTSPTIAKLPSVGEDDGSTDSICSDDDATTSAHVRPSGKVPEHVNAGQASEDGRTAEQRQDCREVLLETSQHIEDATRAASVKFPLDRIVSCSPGHPYVEQDPTQRGTVVAASENVANGAAVSPAMPTQEVSSNMGLRSIQASQPLCLGDTSPSHPRSPRKPGRDIDADGSSSRSSPLSTGLKVSENTSVTCDDLQPPRASLDKPKLPIDADVTESVSKYVLEENMHTSIHEKGETLRNQRRERHSARVSPPRPSLYAGRGGEVLLGMGCGNIESVVEWRLPNDSAAPREAGTHTQHATRRDASVPPRYVTSAGATEAGDVQAPFPLNLPQDSVDGLRAPVLDGAPRFAGDPESVPLTPFLDELGTVDWVNFLERVDWDQFVDIS